ncbi:P-loop containing nucleoside triphosphate hydrolase protein [Mytilinidion resinicola]|uniref:P-loop containing nucleoside triphosphate hydrolase protein n=1 Tax=Mytilinidion resinicola TaxID=574789 RepID=A0A6A6Z2A8_9PEZI|nr:P-loop containing nucleoside triphosphate hydrolase protein [Mytilinidion resinicola]KAF2815241.1 P-loop containing nucleoside triphosphate hydrolase protein [Mytilinidion resinicola]
MEVAGLALGVAGLAGLFSACANGFALIRRGRALGNDFRILEAKFSNQELRLRAWGRACGFDEDGEAGRPGVEGADTDKSYDERLNMPELIVNIAETLECIKMLLCDGAKLRGRYGLKPCPVDENNDAPSPTLDSVDVAEKWKNSNRLSFLRSLKADKEKISSFRSSAAWAIEDKSKFAELVSHLKDFIDDLENLTRATGVPRRQLVFIGYEIESITDMETLEEMEMAREGEDDAVSDAASLRLEVTSEATSSARVSIDSKSLRSFITMESYETARSRFSAPSSRLSVSSSTAIKTEVDLKCAKVLVTGPLESHKTQLLSRFNPTSLLRPYIPTAFEKYQAASPAFLLNGHIVVPFNHDDHDILLSLWDTVGEEDYDRRQLYLNADVVLICISASITGSNEIRQKWVPEAKSSHTPYMLVEIKPDDADGMFTNVAKETEEGTRVSTSDMLGSNLAEEVGALFYLQCSLSDEKSVQQVFERMCQYLLPNSAKSTQTPLSRTFNVPSDLMICKRQNEPRLVSDIVNKQGS